MGIFFLGSVQLVFMGILGEYVSDLHPHPAAASGYRTERINFESDPGPALHMLSSRKPEAVRR